MPYNTTSFPAFLRSLGLESVPVNSKPGRIIAGPPLPVFQLALKLGLGRFIFDTPRSRELLANLGLSPEYASMVGKEMRSSAAWRPLWEGLAQPHLKAAEEAMAVRDQEKAVREAHKALGFINVASLSDGYYIRIPMAESRPLAQTAAQLYERLRTLSGDRVDRLTIDHPHGTTTGLLHFPPGNPSPSYSTILAIHPTGGNKDSYDFALRYFREAGFATCCIDLPAHGDNFDGPRLQLDDECVAVAALDQLATHPLVDPNRLAVTGGSLGAFFAQRTATASPRVKACLAFASPFDIGNGLRDAVPGIQNSIQHVLGGRDLPHTYELAKPFHLRDTVEHISCPLALIHGTLDHICDFTAPYEIARRVKASFDIFPIVGADHEVAQPGSDKLSRPGIEWLQKTLR
jgi:dipeptidyl aminopeptidase/acylaminoacyl peptidase